MDMTEPRWPDVETDLPVVAIAGGGIAGLYVAWKLALSGKAFPLVFERSADRWGGRIETSTLHEFVAELGPMRFEPHLQPLFKALIADLGLDLVPFSGPVAAKVDWPQYDLLPDEKGKSSLELLYRGVVRMAGRDPDDPRTRPWLNGLTESDYDAMRKSAQLDGRPMWELGIWNGLGTVLSHQAVMAIRDTGTFYHMIPDNLNAVEWMIWWLRAFKDVGAHMVTVDGGSRRITEELMERLFALRDRRLLHLQPGAQVIGFNEERGRVRVRFLLDGRPAQTVVDRLVLALPKAPLEELSASLPEHVRPLLDSVIGFPMTKVFFVTSQPWWDEHTPPQTRANRMPTREVHYFRLPPPAADPHGMVLLYTDRPATEFWAPYVVDRDHHDRAEIDRNPALKKPFARYVAKEAQLAARRAREGQPHHLRLTAAAQADFADLPLDEIARRIEDSIVTYAIRDWSRPPYGAANHSWRPGVRSLEVRATLRAFGWPNQPRNLHVCGEAYSDYSGFIEGALRTAEDVLAAIGVDETGGGGVATAP
jgi:hypothetical protein